LLPRRAAPLHVTRERGRHEESCSNVLDHAGGHRQWGGSRTLPGETNNTQYDNQEPLDKAPGSTTDR
jgi:hypothetical protein